MTRNRLIAVDEDRDVELDRARLEAVAAGLRESPPRLSPVWFYDARGSALFERICGLPEYYLTRTEIGIGDSPRPAPGAMTSL